MFHSQKRQQFSQTCPNVTITTEYSLPVKSPIILTEDISYEETVAIGDTLEVAELMSTFTEKMIKVLCQIPSLVLPT